VILTPADLEWPAEAFRGLQDPPPALFLRGRLPPAGVPALAVVGTRRATPYGVRMASRIAEDLARRGFWIVSGLAVGIDTAAHVAALAAAPAGGTLAVLGCGLDHPYPVENLALRERIAREGGVLSEHPPGTPPLQSHFPRRNRIVAALAQGVLVVEAPLKSGALITARIANLLGREVFAVPGPADRFTHVGCHALLRAGEAALVASTEDLLLALGFETGSAPAGGSPLPAPPAGPAATVWAALDPDEPRDADDLCRRTGLSPDEVTEGLTLLELDGRAERVPGAGHLRRA
jgi:DNA processing protein